MNYNTLRYEVDAGIATLRLHRPDKLNAFNNEMLNELLAVLDLIDADDAVRAVIVTGEGRAFCAGADLSGGADTFNAGRGRAEGGPADHGAADGNTEPAIRADGSLNYAAESARDGGGRVTLRIFRCLKPMIAAINGAAVGVGATMTLPMDIRLASDTARVGFVFARRGIVPEAASSYFLPRVVGISRALEWCYSGRLYSAAEARAGGLIREVYPPAELLPAARALAREIVENTAPVSIALIRQMMWRGLGMSDPMEAHRVESRGILSRGRSADVTEGVNSFLEKRTPIFADKVSADLPDFFPWWDESRYR